MRSKVKTYWINKGLVHKTLYTLRLVNGSGGRVQIMGHYKKKKEALHIGELAMGKNFNYVLENL